MNKKKKRIASDSGAYRGTSSAPSYSRSSSSPLISSSTDLSHGRATSRSQRLFHSIRPRGRVCKLQFRGEMHLDAQRRRSAAVRGGQGRRLRKQMGCKVGSGGTRRLRREKKRRETRNRDEGKRERRLCPGRTQVSV